MKVLVLGSGISAGIPAWNDGSEAALRARAQDADLPRREGAALAVSADGLRYSVLEAPFHLPATLSRHPRFAPAAGSRAVPIDSLLLTSGDLDANAGALALRSGLSIRVVSPVGLRTALLDHDAAFTALEPLWTGLPWDRPFPLDREESLEARLFPLPGPVPDHLRERSTAVGRSRCGIRITDRHSGTRLVWAPRIGRYDSATLAELRAADIRFVDGTCYSEVEGRQIRPGAGSASDLGHAPIDGREGSLAWLAGMGGRSIYIHLSATNPIGDARSKEAARVIDAGIEIAHDGLEFEQ
jgi:pyrroloquinoline quinone biosynthesis protein B